MIIAPRRTLAVLLAATLILAGCGKVESSAGAGDSQGEAWEAARGSVLALADDAIVLSAGNAGGLALADVPEAWSFTAWSPSTRHLYSVVVDHGEARPARDLGVARGIAGPVEEVVSIDEVAVGAEQAVVAAREFAEARGPVPPNVIVSGAFAEVGGGGSVLGEAGTWNVTFATGTDLADAQRYAVDMTSGRVTAVTR